MKHAMHYIKLLLHRGPQKGANVFLTVPSSKINEFLRKFSLLDLEMNGTCDSMNFTHFT